MFSNDKFKYFKIFLFLKDLLVFLSRKKLMRSYKHKGNHITVNTIEELEQAKLKIKNFNVTKKNNFWKNKTVFITGISGFVGSNLAKSLLKEDAKIVGLT